MLLKPEGARALVEYKTSRFPEHVGASIVFIRLATIFNLSHKSNNTLKF